MTAREKEFEDFLDCDVICDDFFDEIVANNLNIARNKFQRQLVLIRSAAGDNDNYNSILCRVKIKVKLLDSNENVSVNVIMKASLKAAKEFTDKFGYFTRECLMYEDLLKSFECMWLESANEVVKFAPQSFKFVKDPYDIIVLEDLKASQYEMLDRKVGCTLLEAKLLLSKLAKFHAASAVRYRKDGMIHQCFDRKYPVQVESPFVKVFTDLHVAFVDALKSYGDCDIFVEKVAAWNVKKIFNFWQDGGEAMRCGFTVLGHSDLWINNVMFNKVDIDVKIFDFQATSWASPAYDIFYFILTSIENDVKVKNFDSLIEFYHQELSKGLITLNYVGHVPTLEELHLDLMDKGTFTAVCIMFLLFIFKYDCSEELNLQMIMGMVDDREVLEKMYHRIYRNETYRNALKSWLPFLNERGFLDTMLD